MTTLQQFQRWLEVKKQYNQEKLKAAHIPFLKEHHRKKLQSINAALEEISDYQKYI